MRPRGQISAAGSIVVILIAALGFAAVSTDPPSDEAVIESPARPETLSARVLAAGFAANLNPEIEPAAEAVLVQPAPTPRAAPTTTTAAPGSTTTTRPPTTTTIAPATTTTKPPATTTTTTTTEPPATTTTTTAPTTTEAPTTTVAATTTTTLPPVEGGARDVEEWRYLVEQYFAAELVDEALAVMRCESLGDPLAYNPISGASGLFQFIPSTWAWASEGAGFVGASPFEPAANVGSAAWLVQRSLNQGKDAWSHWTCNP